MSSPPRKVLVGLAVVIAACSGEPMLEPNGARETGLPPVEPEAAAAPVAPTGPLPAAVTLPACTHRWAGAANGSWFTATSWTPASVPGAASVACIDVAGTYTVTLDPPNDATPVAVDGIAVGGGASGTQTLALAGTAALLNVGSGIDIKAGGVLNLPGANGIIVTAPTIANAGRLATLPTCGGCGDATIRADLDNAGTLSVAGNGLILDKVDGVYRNTGTIDVLGVLRIPAGAGSPTFTLESGMITSTLTNPNNADFRMQAGSFTYAGGNALSTNRGLVTLEGVNLTFGPSPAGTAAFSMLPSTGSNTFTGNIGPTHTLRMPTVGGAHTMSSRTLTLVGDVVNDGTIEFQPSPSTGYAILAGTGSLTNKGTLLSSGAGGDSLRIAIDLRNEGRITSNGRFLHFDQPARSYVNAGTINGTGTLRVRGATLTNEAAGKLDILTELHSAARLRGTGTNTASLRAFTGSIVDPGFSPGILTVGGLQNINGGILDIELGGDTPGTGYDQIQSAGQSTLSNGTLRVRAIDGFEAGKCGQVFDIIIHNSPGGIGSFVATEGLDQGNGRTLKVLYGKPVIKLVGLDAGKLVATRTEPLPLTEGGAPGTYYVCLGQRPNSDVTVAPTADAQVTVSPASLTFTSSDWELPKAFTITAVDDQAAEGDHTGQVSHAVSSTDTRFNDFTLGKMTANITDNDVNTAPSASDDVAQTNEDTPVTIDALANDQDPEGESLTIISAVAQHGSTALPNGGASIQYTPLPDYFGADAITYQIRDGRGQTATGTITVTVAPINDPPQAVADIAVTRTRRAVSIAVLANDGDPDGDVLTVSQVSPPAHGTATITAAGKVTYRSAANYIGADQFTYTITSSGGGSSSAAVSVNVIDPNANTPPVAVDDAVSLGSRVQLRIPVLANDSDPDGDALVILNTSSPIALGTAAISGKSILYTKPGAMLKRLDGIDQFTYTVRDAHGTTATATVRVTWTPEWDVDAQRFNLSTGPHPHPNNPTHMYGIAFGQWAPIPGSMTATVEFVLPAGATRVGAFPGPNDGGYSGFVPAPNCTVVAATAPIYRCTVTGQDLNYLFAGFELPLNRKNLNSTLTVTPVGVRDLVPSNNRIAIKTAICTKGIFPYQNSCAMTQ